MPKLFISISGKKQSGKDFVAAHLRTLFEDLGYSVKITWFAEPLKEILISLFGIPRELVYGSNADKEQSTHLKWENFPWLVRFKYRERWWSRLRTGHMTIRELLQVLGTDIFRKRVHPTVWAEAPFHKDWEEDIVLIPDCRFPNEAEMTHKNEGTVARIEPRGFPRRGYHLPKLSVDKHPSETSLDHYKNFDILIPNTFGRTEMLKEHLKKFVGDCHAKLQEEAKHEARTTD